MASRTPWQGHCASCNVTQQHTKFRDSSSRFATYPIGSYTPLHCRYELNNPHPAGNPRICRVCFTVQGYTQSAKANGVELWPHYITDGSKHLLPSIAARRHISVADHVHPAVDAVLPPPSLPRPVSSPSGPSAPTTTIASEFFSTNPSALPQRKLCYWLRVISTSKPSSTWYVASSASTLTPPSHQQALCWLDTPSSSREQWEAVLRRTTAFPLSTGKRLLLLTASALLRCWVAVRSGSTIPSVPFACTNWDCTIGKRWHCRRIFL